MAMGELDPDNDEDTSTPGNMVDPAPAYMGERKRGHAAIHGEEVADLALPAMKKRKRSSRRHPWGRGSRSRTAGHGEEEEEFPGHGEEEEELAGHGEEGRWPRQRGRGRSRRRSPAAEGKRALAGHGEEERWPPATGKRPLTPPLARCRRGRGHWPAAEGKRALAGHGEEGARAR